MQSAEQILKSKGLRTTKVRLDVLKVFLHNETAIDSNAIEKFAGHKIDRISLYRTLNRFVEKGILHKISMDDKRVSYALCQNCDAYEHKHSHIHFSCEKCEHVTCLEELEIPKISLPKGYELAEASILAKGTCPKCLN